MEEIYATSDLDKASALSLILGIEPKLRLNEKRFVEAIFPRSCELFQAVLAWENAELRLDPRVFGRKVHAARKTAAVLRRGAER
jgi:hypothetical protein